MLARHLDLGERGPDRIWRFDAARIEALRAGTRGSAEVYSGLFPGRRSPSRTEPMAGCGSSQRVCDGAPAGAAKEDAAVMTRITRAMFAISALLAVAACTGGGTMPMDADAPPSGHPSGSSNSGAGGGGGGGGGGYH
jgi:hypothetical protein